MKNTTLTPVDGYDQRDDEQSTGGAEYAKFDAATQSLWHWRDGAATPRGPYYGVGCQIELLRWDDKRAMPDYPKARRAFAGP